MIQPVYIESILKQNDFNVQYLNGINTGAINMHSFSVQGTETDMEIVTIKYAKVFGNKVFISTNSGVDVLGENLTRKLEETILVAIAMTPENRLPNLLNPIFFSSENFTDLMDFEIDVETVEEDFCSAVYPIFNRVKSDTFSFYVLSLPVNKHSEYLISLFEKMDSCHSTVCKNNKILVKFYSFHERAFEEHNLIYQVRDSLSTIGIFAEVEDIMEF